MILTLKMYGFNFIKINMLHDKQKTTIIGNDAYS